MKPPKKRKSGSHKPKLCCLVAKASPMPRDVFCVRCREIWCNMCYRSFESENYTHIGCGGQLYFESVRERLEKE